MIDLIPPAMLHMMNLFLLGQEEASAWPWTQIGIALVVIAVLVVPFLIGSFLARRLRMPLYGFRIGAILFAVTAAGAVLAFGQLDWGVDLRGGTILVYELAADATIQQPTEGEDPLQAEVGAADVIPALINRINPSGTQEIVIRPYGERQIEIIIPDVDAAGVEFVKRQIVQAGILSFAIVANSRDHQALIETAYEASESEDRQERMARNLVDSAGRTIGFWADVDREDRALDSGVQPLRLDVSGSTLRNPATGEIVQLPSGLVGGAAIAEYMQAVGIRELQILMSVNPDLVITGEDLSYVSQGYDTDGSPSVRFSLRDAGSSRFYALTLNNAPDGNFRRQLGIVLDNRLLSAPVINSAISTDGTISGNFTNAETEFLVNILRAGQLPAALNKTPISENQIGATLGADTIRKGLIAITASLVAVLVFMLFYYRFAGFVACLALILNVALIFASMMLINQPLTLPGLAGLVLTVGMSVDANVLIFERIREEINRGAAPRMAIRNGFGRATITIVDANLTTLITAIVLYAIGTDQVRGFAVTLILGIVFSMFTAIYFARTLFDIAERYGWASLRMADLVGALGRSADGHSHFDFMGKGKIAAAVSIVLIIIGLTGLWFRGGGILDIDFAGGSSVTFQLDDPVPADEVRRLVEQSLASDEDDTPVQFTLNRVDVENAANETVYKIDASLENVEALKDRLRDGFLGTEEASLVTYHVEIEPADAAAAPPAGEAAAPATEETGAATANNGVRLVSALAPQDEEEAPANETQATGVTEDVAAAADQAVERAAPVYSEALLTLSIDGQNRAAKINYQTLKAKTIEAAERAGIELQEFAVDAEPVGETIEDWSPESNLSFSTWKLRVDLPAEQADQVMAELRSGLDSDPVWLSSSNISGRVAGQMINRALAALFASLLFIIGYIWFRFQRVAFGLAAVVALIHDVAITLGAIAVSYWLADVLGFLMIDPFKISLTVVAALLTIIGYSLNDTIVIFDRIRETRGKSPRLTSEMINSSINQTLSRTVLTSLTTLLVVVLLYFFGGEGIHAFAFSLVVGVVAGTYSTVFIASPVLLWLVNRDTAQAAR
ncbi:protein translocase subunit SecD [Candidatus Laterigemmans baculatus]|uniref:protein translocase subunit SecD n=1 Tax=Candidatus Laterigemmans baculatus TaxID=2770505 RepID=UPI0013DD14DB|nr:protein translocase subunit SecD [Candidatus Laterigemmans baculatus]